MERPLKSCKVAETVSKRKSLWNLIGRTEHNNGLPDFRMAPLFTLLSQENLGGVTKPSSSSARTELFVVSQVAYIWC